MRTLASIAFAALFVFSTCAAAEHAPASASELKRAIANGSIPAANANALVREAYDPNPKPTFNFDASGTTFDPSAGPANYSNAPITAAEWAVFSARLKSADASRDENRAKAALEDAERASMKATMDAMNARRALYIAEHAMATGKTPAQAESDIDASYEGNHSTGNTH